MIYKNFKQRQPGTTPIPYNFEVQTAAPIDPRTIVQNNKKLYDTSAWLINDSIKTYLYPGLVITDINEDNTTLKQYVYKGEPFVADSSNPSEPQVPGIWQCITFTNNEQQTIYPLNWKENPNDTGINLNQYALYFGDSSNGEILISNLPNNPNTTFHMSDTGINLFYKDMYHIEIDSANGISLYKENGAKINLHEDDISVNTKHYNNEVSTYKISASEKVDVSSHTLVQNIKNRYILNSLTGDVSIDNLTINDVSLQLNSDVLQVTSKESIYRLISNKIYTSDFTIYYANPDDISNNTLTPTNTIPCIQIFNRDSSDPNNTTTSLQLNNNSKDNQASLSFMHDGKILMTARKNINLDVSEGNITLHNNTCDIALYNTTGILSLTGNNGINLNAGNQQLNINSNNIEILSDNIQLWNNRYTLPVPDRDRVELLRFNKNKLEWTDSALLKTATISRLDIELNKPAAIRIAQAIYIYKTGNTHELWKPSITFAVNTEEGSGIFNAQVLPVAKTQDKVDYMLNIQCINNRNMFNTNDNIPYVTGRIYYMNNGQYVEHAYNNQNSVVICEIYVVTSYNTANWAFLSYTQDGEIKKDNAIRNIWKLTESITKINGDNTITIPEGIDTGTTWDATKKMYTQHEVLPHIVKSINFTSVGTTQYSFNEIPYPVESDLGKFLQVDSNHNFVWQEAAMKTYNAEGKNYIIGSLNPAQGKTLTKGTYQEQVYFTNTGDMYARNYYATSDINKKTDITDISISNNNIHTVAFKWKDTSIQSYGFIAQEIEKQYPELVNTDEDGSKTVNYIAALSLYTAQLENRIKILEDKLKERQ